MLNFVMTIDCILLLRLLPACLSRKSMNNLKCYYSFRIATFWILMAGTVLGFLYLCWLVVLEKTAAYTPIIQAIVLGFIALIDYNFCAVVRTQLMKVIKKDRKKQRKIKGRMLSQKAHKGPIRIDTPPPFHISNDHKSNRSRVSRQRINPSSGAVSPRYSLSRTKTLHRAKSSDEDSNGHSIAGSSIKGYYRKRKASFQS